MYLVLIVVLATEYTSAKREFSVYRKCAMRYILLVCKEECFGSANDVFSAYSKIRAFKCTPSLQQRTFLSANHL